MCKRALANSSGILACDPTILRTPGHADQPEKDTVSRYINSSFTAIAHMTMPMTTSSTCHARGLAKSGARSRAP